MSRRAFPLSKRSGGVVVSVFACALACGCAKPYLANDGTLLFPEKGARGAAVVTANGVEFHDRTDVPERVVLRDPSEPWRAPIGFILPQNGRFTQTSSPTVVTTSGLAIVLRPSDTRVPSWGGEVLVRIDIIAPAAEGTARYGENVAVIFDDAGEDTIALTDAAIGQLAGRDRMTVIDARGAKVVLPLMPATHRSMAIAAVENRLAAHKRGAPDLAAALRKANASLASDVVQRIVVLGDTLASAYAPDVRAELDRLASRHVIVSAVGTTAHSDIGALSAVTAIGGGVANAGVPLEERLSALKEAIPIAGEVTFKDVKLTFEGTPAPSHVLEASGGEVRWRLESGELVLGEVRAGEARTEVVRVTVPAWVPGEDFRFTVTARVFDVAYGGKRGFAAQLPCTYDDDIERIAKSRHGDVIAYSSAMATLRRLQGAFVGNDVTQAGGLRRVAELHARSMMLLARDTHDRAIQEQADLLAALLDATR